MKLRKIGVMSAALMSLLIYGAIGLIAGLFISFFTMMGAAVGEMSGQDGFFAMFFGVGAIFLLPIFYGIIGFVSGAVCAFIYNVFAKMTGGLELEFDQPADQPMP